jgi:hypothetical protein
MDSICNDMQNCRYDAVDLITRHQAEIWQYLGFFGDEAGRTYDYARRRY